MQPPSSHASRPPDQRRPVEPAAGLRTGVPAPARWWDESLYPFASRFCDLSTGLVHYIDHGTGPVLLFLPPAPLWSFIYRDVILRLRAHFRCVAIDFPGFGPSPVPATFRVELRAMSRTVEEIIDTLDLRDVTLVGHDSGGLVGLHAAGRRPERFAGFVLVDTIGFALGRFSPIRIMLRLVASPVSMRVQERWNLLAQLITSVGVRRRRLSPPERAAYLRAFPDRPARRRPLEVFREMVRSDDFLGETGRGLVQLRDRPVLSIFGQFDPVRLLGMQQKFAASFSRHRGVVVRREAHFVPEGAPEEMVAAILDWWSEEVVGRGPR